jgi:shikimate kinase
MPVGTALVVVLVAGGSDVVVELDVGAWLQAVRETVNASATKHRDRLRCEGIMGAPREEMTGQTRRHVVLVGAMGVGKTTLGAALATRLGVSFLDSDTEIESKHGHTGAEIASEDGVPALHDIELAVFAEMADRVEPAVIAPAASVVDRDEGRRLLDEHIAVWVRVPSAVAEERRSTSSHRRAIDAEEQQMRDESRRRWLENLADVEVDNTRSLEMVVEEIAAEVTKRLAT